MKKHLMEVALLGTEKKNLDMELLPTGIQHFMSARNHGDVELKFLETLSAMHYYDECGKSLMKFSGSWNEEAIEETKAIAPPGLNALFGKLELVEFGIRENMFSQWLSVFVERQLIVDPELITKLLAVGKSFTNETKHKISEAIGNRGNWILSYSGEANFKQTQNNSDSWQEGTLTERKNFFLSLRKNNAGQSVDLLKSTWSSESVVNKRAFLELLAENSTPDEIAYLEELYRTEFAFQPKEKKTEKECRRIIASILLSHEGSSLHKKTTEQMANSFIRAKKGILGLVTGKESVSFNTPDDNDPFWNATIMEQTYGFEVKSIDIALYNQPWQFWLSLFVNYLPAKFWASLFDGEYRRMLDYLLKDKKFTAILQGKVHPILKQSLIDSVQAHHDSTMALELVNLLPVAEAIPLMVYLKKGDFESFVQKNKYLDDYGILQSGPFAAGEQWSLSLSREVLKRAFEKFTLNIIPSVSGQLLSRYVHIDLMNDVLQLNEKARTLVNYDQWNKYIFEPVHSALEIRTTIDSFKKQ